MTTRITDAQSRARWGFTLLEMMLAMVIMLLVLAITYPLFRSQLRAMDSNAGRLDAQQNVRFAISALDRELRVAGAGVPSKQPLLVQADPYAITFNADLATRDTSSEGGAYGAVYFNPDLPAGATMSMTPATQITLPLSAAVWPTVSYYKGGPLSSAETISFWIAPDLSNGSNGRFALYRRVNALPIDTLARGLVIDSGSVPFTYQVLDSLGNPTTVLSASLPAFHSAQHGAPDDTGASALTDRIRSVSVRLKARFVERDGSLTERRADASIRLLNAGLLNLTTCGEAPVFGQTASGTYTATPQPQVVLSWNRALDESGGEKDVERYVIYRKLSAATDFGEPVASIPAGRTSYQFADSQIKSGTSYVYAVAATDCGGQVSPLSATSQIPVP